MCCISFSVERDHAPATRHPRRHAALGRRHLAREHHLRRKMGGLVTQIATPMRHGQCASGNILEQKCSGWGGMKQTKKPQKKWLSSGISTPSEDMSSSLSVKPPRAGIREPGYSSTSSEMLLFTHQVGFAHICHSKKICTIHTKLAKLH